MYVFKETWDSGSFAFMRILPTGDPSPTPNTLRGLDVRAEGDHALSSGLTCRAVTIVIVI